MREASLDPSVRGTAVVVTLVCAASVGLLIMTGGNVALAIAPVAAVGLLYLFWRLPLRVTGAGVLWMMLSFERPEDAANLYHTSFYPLGLAVNTKLSVVLGIKPLQFTGSDLLCLLILLVSVVRAGTESDIPDRGRVQAARPLAVCAAIFALTTAIEFAFGLLGQGDFSVALSQFRALLHIPFYFLTFQVCLRGPQDYKLLGRTLVLAATTRACLALWIRFTAFETGILHPIAFMTSHDDSITFAAVMMMLLVALNEEGDRRALLRCVLFLPIIVWGAVVNNRRLVWVDLGSALMVYAFISPRTRLKRAAQRGLIGLIPVVLLYLVVGWDSTAKIFGPVQLLKSVISSDADRSTLDRDVENWNLATSMRSHPLFGRGLGHEYDEKIPMDDISGAFPAYRSFPHNSVLGLWVFFGLVGMLGLWPLVVSALYLGARGYHWARSPSDRAAAYSAVGVVIIFLNQSFGDMAFWGDIGPIFVGVALVVAGKSAVASGAWPAQPLRSVYLEALSRESSGKRWPRSGAPAAAP